MKIDAPRHKTLRPKAAKVFSMGGQICSLRLFCIESRREIAELLIKRRLRNEENRDNAHFISAETPGAFAFFAENGGNVKRTP